MPFIPSARIICPVCSQTVYPNDEVRISENLILHKTCFRCSQCNKVLQNTNFSTYEGDYYCKPHFMSLFKARGKYDDLAATSSLSTTMRHSFKTENDTKTLSATMGAEPVASGFSKKGDLNSALRTRNSLAVQGVIDKKGLHVMFSSGADGITAIETAFTTGNLECGRVMLKEIAAALQGQEFVWEKAPEADNKEESAPAEEHHNHAGHNHFEHEVPRTDLPEQEPGTFLNTQDVFSMSDPAPELPPEPDHEPEPLPVEPEPEYHHDHHEPVEQEYHQEEADEAHEQHPGGEQYSQHV